MAQFVGFDQYIRKTTPAKAVDNRPKYKSESKGEVVIADMHNNHLFNALRKQVRRVLIEKLNDCNDVHELFNLIDWMHMSVLRTDSVVDALCTEVENRDDEEYSYR